MFVVHSCLYWQRFHIAWTFLVLAMKLMLFQIHLLYAEARKSFCSAKDVIFFRVQARLWEVDTPKTMSTWKWVCQVWPSTDGFNSHTWYLLFDEQSWCVSVCGFGLHSSMGSDKLPPPRGAAWVLYLFPLIKHQ